MEQENNQIDVNGDNNIAEEKKISLPHLEDQNTSSQHRIELPQAQTIKTHSSTSSGKLTLDNNPPGENLSSELFGSLNVEILNFEKIGEGMGAYVIFIIKTTTDIPIFKSNEMTVKRRFSDFLGLYTRLLNAHMHKGILVPPPPDKHNIDSNKYKFVKDLTKENEFLESRRISLLHFLENLIRHPALRTDPILHEFLEFDGTLPKATNTQALSSTSASKLFKSVSDAFNKISSPVDDPDEYFYEKAQELTTLERQFTRLMTSFSTLSINQVELSSSLAGLTLNLEQLSTCEQENRLASKIKRLSGVYGTLANHEAVRAEAESTYLHEMARNIVATVSAAKMLLDERTKCYRRWKENEEMLTAKRTQKTKLDASGKADGEKSNLLQAQIVLAEQKVEDSKNQFTAMCKTIKQEFKRFDMHRFYDMRASMLAYLEILLSVQQKNQDAWTQYLQVLESGSL